MKFIDYFVVFIACFCIHVSANQNQQASKNAVILANQFALNVTLGQPDAFIIRLLTQLNTAFDKTFIKLKCNHQHQECQHSHDVAVFEISYIIINSLVGNNPDLTAMNNAGWLFYGDKTKFYKHYANTRAVARKIAYQVLQSQLDDGFNSYQPYVYSNSKYAWRSSDNEAPAPAQNGKVKAYVIGNYEDAEQRFNVQPPIQPGSPDFLTQLNEVKQEGESSAVLANPQHKLTADLWNKDTVPTRVTNLLVQNIIMNAYNPAYGGSSTKYAARTLRIVNTAIHDCFFFIYHLKFKYNALRPQWFIHNGLPSVNGQPSLAADPSWMPYNSGDTSPVYPDTYASFTGGLSVLKKLVGAISGPITYESAYLGETISYSSLEQLQNDILSSDIYAGTNFRYTNFGFADVCAHVAKEVAREIKKNP